MYSELDLQILKAITTNRKCALEFVSENDAKLFAPEVWNFANVVINYIKNYKDTPTLRVITEKFNKNSNEKLIEYINKIWKEVESVKYDEKEYKHDLEKLKLRFAEKQLFNAKESLNKVDFNSLDVNKTVSELQKTIQNVKNLSQSKTYESKSLKDALPWFTENFKLKKENPDFNKGMSTGYSFIDWATNGIKPSDFVLVCAESGHGKSTLLSNMATNIWKQSNTLDSNNFVAGKNIVYFSLEMPYENCFNRLVSSLSGVPYKKIENAKCNKEELVRLRKALDFINRYPNNFTIVDIPRMASANDMEAIINDLKQEHPIDAVFVDYLGIMTPNETKEEQDWLKQGIISYELREIARAHHVPMFSAVQLNRKGKSSSEDDSIGLHRLSRSSAIATNATTIIQLVSRDKEAMYPTCKYALIKNRNGPLGSGQLIKKLDCSTFLDDPIEINNDYEVLDQDDISDDVDDLEL
jgi:replicative DNA helicase